MKRTVTVEVLPDGVHSRTSPSGAETARSVASLVRQFGGYTFDFPAMDGSSVEVSLEHLRDRDPDTAMVVVSLREIAENDVERAAMRVD